MEAEQKKTNWAVFSVKCCNPLKETGHSKSGKLRTVTEWMCSLGLETVVAGMKICDGCRLKLNPFSKEHESNQQTFDQESTTMQGENDCYVDRNSSLQYLNKSLELVGESPIKKKKLTVDSYKKQKLEKVKSCIETTFLGPENVNIKNSETVQDELEMITQLKNKFSETTSRSEKLIILSVLPRSWSRRKIQTEFGVSDYMARAVKKLVYEKGILSSPNPKPGKSLDSTTVQHVLDFYNRDDVSRVMPGKKDVVAVRMENQQKVHLQKRLVLTNLNELYQMFKTEYASHKIGFSKFCELRPQNCILAGKSGTHTVCVCTLHQNVKLMMHGAKLNSLALVGDNATIKNWQDCLYQIMCNPPSPNCYMNNCKECPEKSHFEDLINQKFEDELIDSVTYKKWLSVDRCTLETVVKEKNEFIEEFMEELLKLKPHSFIANMQKDYFNSVKSSLQAGEVAIICDFAENYSFVLQDEVQSYHWTNSQATLHPFVVYYAGEDGKLKHLNYVFISECLTHNTIAFNLFQKKLISALKEAIPSLRKIYYFSDGCAGQYKNRKNFLNICLHKNDFGIDAEWHFFATSHGKNACDGLGGTVKRLATKASLQRPYDQQIMTPYQLFEFANVHIPGIEFKYCTTEEYNENEKILTKRFEKTKTVKGTHKFHAVIPVSETQIETRIYSLGNERTIEEPAMTDGSSTDMENVESGFVTVAYDNFWWLACILAKKHEVNEIKVSFLHPRGPARSFYYPQPKQDILDLKIEDLLKKVSPRTATGRMYTLTEEEMATSAVLLKNKTEKRCET